MADDTVLLLIGLILGSFGMALIILITVSLSVVAESWHKHNRADRDRIDKLERLGKDLPNRTWVLTEERWGLSVVSCDYDMGDGRRTLREAIDRMEEE